MYVFVIVVFAIVLFILIRDIWFRSHCDSSLSCSRVHVLCIQPVVTRQSARCHELNVGFDVHLAMLRCR